MAITSEKLADEIREKTLQELIAIRKVKFADNFGKLKGSHVGAAKKSNLTQVNIFCIIPGHWPNE